MEVLTTAEMERADRLSIAAGTPGFAPMAFKMAPVMRLRRPPDG